MKLTRHYLTADEIGAIVYEMLKDDNVIDENGNPVIDENGNEVYVRKTEYQRQMVKYGIIAQLLIEGLIEDNDEKSTNDYYTDAISNGIDLDIEVDNIDLIDRIVDKELGLAKTVEGMLNGIINNIDEQMKNIDPKSLILELDKLQKA